MRNVEAIFRQVYLKEVWGRGRGSGDGSTPAYCASYIAYLQELVDSGRYREVIDLGCGDCQVASAVRWKGVSYVGADCVDVPSRRPVPHARIEICDFRAPEELERLFALHEPDLVLVKDVLQHLADDEVADFAERLSRLSWKTLLVTNDWRYMRSPARNGTPRSVDNPYTWAPLPCDAAVLAPLALSPVLHYPRNRRKQVSRSDRT